MTDEPTSWCQKPAFKQNEPNAEVLFVWWQEKYTAVTWCKYVQRFLSGHMILPSSDTFNWPFTAVLKGVIVIPQMNVFHILDKFLMVTLNILKRNLTTFHFPIRCWQRCHLAQLLQVSMSECLVFFLGWWQPEPLQNFFSMTNAFKISYRFE